MATSTDLRKLSKITSVQQLYKALAQHGPSEAITLDVYNGYLEINQNPKSVAPTAVIKASEDMQAEYYKFKKFAKYAACIKPNPEVVKKIATFAPEILEVGAGTGLWAKLLTVAGAKVVVSDIDPPPKSEQFIRVVKLSAEDALKKHHSIDCLMMCISEIPFPTQFTGQRCVVIGGDPSLAVHPTRASIQHTYSRGYPSDLEWEIVEEVPIPTWWGERGLCRMYRRRAIPLEAPVLDAPVIDAPVIDAPVVEAPVVDAPKVTKASGVDATMMIGPW